MGIKWIGDDSDKLTNKAFIHCVVKIQAHFFDELKIEEKEACKKLRNDSNELEETNKDESLLLFLVIIVNSEGEQFKP